jgi:4-hydroxybenzoate polyprenyltransferase
MASHLQHLETVMGQMISQTVASSTAVPSAWLPYLQLIRPANLVTAAADVLAGFAAAGMAEPRVLPLLVCSSVALYAGGVTFNDVFDANLDRIERPERPIPSGRVPLRTAALFGALLLIAGVTAAASASLVSGAIALLIGALAVIYDAGGKHRKVGGPLNMAACRALNLLLGISAAPSMIRGRWYLAAIPFLYIAAITLLSRGEVHGGRRQASFISFTMLACAIAGLLLLGLVPPFAILAALPFIVLLGWRVMPCFWRAVSHPEPGVIRRAVMAGVLSLIVLDSALAAGYAGMMFGMAILALSLLAGGIARLFSVT